MSLISINRHPTQRQLRQFGIAAMIALPVIAIVWRAAWPITGLWAGLGVMFAVVGWWRPNWLKPLFVAMSVLAAPIGLIIGEVVLLVIYFAVLTPLALVMRCTGRDPLERRLDPDAASYWKPYSPPRDVSRYYRQS